MFLTVPEKNRMVTCTANQILHNQQFHFNEKNILLTKFQIIREQILAIEGTLYNHSKKGSLFSLEKNIDLELYDENKKLLFDKKIMW